MSMYSSNAAEKIPYNITLKFEFTFSQLTYKYLFPWSWLNGKYTNEESKHVNSIYINIQGSNTSIQLRASFILEVNNSNFRR
jgi:hypothetical protein